MKIAVGEDFITEVPIQGVLPMLPKQGIKDRARMIAYIKEEADKKVSPFADTYWEGKYLDRLATLSRIAEMAEAPELQKIFMYHWIQTLDTIGLNDASVTADNPFTNVFIKDKKKTYSLYNFGKKALKVTFSDGKTMNAKPGDLSVETR